MPKYVIERLIPDAGSLTAQDLKEIARKSNAVVGALGPRIQWVQSFVADDRLYCTYIAPDEALIREHARRGGFPADTIRKVNEVFDPTTAEG